MTIGVNACSVCTRLDPDAQPVEEDGLTLGKCEAFPEGIPADIWTGDHAHRVAFDGEDLLWDGDEAEHAAYVDLFEVLAGEPPEGLLNPG